jgi:hypothetical protein
MAIGIPVTVNDVNNIFGGIARDLDSTMTRVLQASLWLAAQTDAALEALPTGGAAASILAADAAVLRSAWADLVQAAQIYQGLLSGANYHGGAAYDARTFAKQLIAINAH